MGHSFGGVTALKTGLDDKRVKGIVCLDPWLFPLEDKYYEMKT
jgi:hypothetical protein